MTQEFRFNPKQLEAQEILAGDAHHIMLFGGSRSGKTFLLTRNVVFRALKAKDSRHAILRFRYNAAVASILMDTLPKVMRLCFPQVSYKLDKQKGIVFLPNKSEIWVGGLDDKERSEKVLGQEFVTIYLNECSQIPWGSVGLVRTRLAQQVTQIIGDNESALIPRAYYDCNPPSKAHWSYQQFILKRDPESKMALNQPDDFVSFQINPQDNAVNQATGYLESLKGMSARLQKRFLLGEFADATPNALFADEIIDKWRVMDGIVPDFVRVVVGVDPSGCGDADNADNDAIGIIVGAIGTDGNAYLLEDCTVKAGPATWGKIATDAFERHDADIVVGETNYGGAMVHHVITTARPRTPYKQVTASRGKVVRAEPFSALYEQGKIRHVGYFRDLEDELSAFTTNGYMGENSPNRADAWVWVLTELFPGMVKQKKEKIKPESAGFLMMSDNNWMTV